MEETTREYQLKGITVIAVPKRNRKKFMEMNKGAVLKTAEDIEAEKKSIKAANKKAATTAKKKR